MKITKQHYSEVLKRLEKKFARRGRIQSVFRSKQGDVCVSILGIEYDPANTYACNLREEVQQILTGLAVDVSFIDKAMNPSVTVKMLAEAPDDPDITEASAPKFIAKILKGLGKNSGCVAEFEPRHSGIRVTLKNPEPRVGRVTLARALCRDVKVLVGDQYEVTVATVLGTPSVSVQRPKAKQPVESRTTHAHMLVSWSWSCSDLKPAQITKDLTAAVKERFDARLVTFLTEGNTCGDFIETLHTDIPGLVTPDDGWQINGWIDIDRTYDPQQD